MSSTAAIGAPGRVLGQRDSRWSRADTFIVGVLVLTSVVAWLPRFRGPVDFRWDAAVYYLLGTSLAEELSYTLSSEPGDIATPIYPPLLPLLLALHQWLLGTSDPVVVGGWLRITFCLLLTGYSVASYVLLRTRLPIELATPAVALCVLHWFPHWLSDRCYSDLPFAVAAAGFFVLCSRTARLGGAAGICATAAYLLRSAGIALLFAWIAERVVVRDWRRAATRLMIGSISVLAWQGYVFSIERSEAYRQPAYPHQRAAYNIYNVSYARLAALRDHRRPHLGEATSLERVSSFFRNAAMLPVDMGGSVSAPRHGWDAMMERIKSTDGLRRVVPWAVIPVAMGSLGVLIIFGLVRMAREGDVVIPIALILYAAAICVMPTTYMYELPRYLAVLAPVFAIALLKGLQGLQGRVPGYIGIIAVSLLLSGVMTFQVVLLADLYRSGSTELEYSDWRGSRVRYRLFTYDAHSMGQDGAIAWLNQHGRRDAIVVSSSPHWIHLRTGLRAVMPPMESDAASNAALLDAIPATYVLVEEGSFTGEYVGPVVRRRLHEWQPVLADHTNGVALYERRRTDSGAGSALYD